MEGVLEVLSPAKINLTLSVLEKRQDGYHNIDSIVQTISLFDHIYIKKSDSNHINLTCNKNDVPLGTNNIIVKACELMKSRGLLDCGLDIHLEKNIPMQAGMGGGSSNAASVIVALDTMFDLNLGEAELISLGAELGSDVALFIYGGTVRIAGRGDVVRPFADGMRFYYVIVKPECGVSTSWAYAELDKRTLYKNADMGDEAERSWINGDTSKMLQIMHNDFQPVVGALFPEIAVLESRLQDNGAERVLLAGSGSAVAGVFTDRDKRDICYNEFSALYKNIWACDTLGRRSVTLEI